MIFTPLLHFIQKLLQKWKLHLRHLLPPILVMTSVIFLTWSAFSSNFLLSHCLSHLRHRSHVKQVFVCWRYSSVGVHRPWPLPQKHLHLSAIFAFLTLSRKGYSSTALLQLN